MREPLLSSQKTHSGVYKIWGLFVLIFVMILATLYKNSHYSHESFPEKYVAAALDRRFEINLPEEKVGEVSDGKTLKDVTVVMVVKEGECTRLPTDPPHTVDPYLIFQSTNDGKIESFQFNKGKDCKNGERIGYSKDYKAAFNVRNFQISKLENYRPNESDKWLQMQMTMKLGVKDPRKDYRGYWDCKEGATFYHCKVLTNERTMIRKLIKDNPDNWKWENEFRLKGNEEHCPTLIPKSNEWNTCGSYGFACQGGEYCCCAQGKVWNAKKEVCELCPRAAKPYPSTAAECNAVAMDSEYWSSCTGGTSSCFQGNFCCCPNGQQWSKAAGQCEICHEEDTCKAKIQNSENWYSCGSYGTACADESACCCEPGFTAEGNGNTCKECNNVPQIYNDWTWQEGCNPIIPDNSKGAKDENAIKCFGDRLYCCPFGLTWDPELERCQSCDGNQPIKLEKPDKPMNRIFRWKRETDNTFCESKFKVRETNKDASSLSTCEKWCEAQEENNVGMVCAYDTIGQICQLYNWCMPKTDNKHDPLRSNWEVSRFTVIEMKCDPFLTASEGVLETVRQVGRMMYKSVTNMLCDTKDQEYENCYYPWSCYFSSTCEKICEKNESEEEACQEVTKKDMDDPWQAVKTALLDPIKKVQEKCMGKSTVEEQLADVFSSDVPIDGFHRTEDHPFFESHEEKEDLMGEQGVGFMARAVCGIGVDLEPAKAIQKTTTAKITFKPKSYKLSSSDDLLTLRGSLVIAVSGWAEEVDIKPGWRIKSIDANDFSKTLYDQKYKGDENFVVTFDTTWALYRHKGNTGITLCDDETCGDFAEDPLDDYGHLIKSVDGWANDIGVSTSEASLWRVVSINQKQADSPQVLTSAEQKGSEYEIIFHSGGFDTWNAENSCKKAKERTAFGLSLSVSFQIGPISMAFSIGVMFHTEMDEHFFFWGSASGYSFQLAILGIGVGLNFHFDVPSISRFELYGDSKCMTYSIKDLIDMKNIVGSKFTATSQMPANVQSKLQYTEQLTGAMKDYVVSIAGPSGAATMTYAQAFNVAKTLGFAGDVIGNLANTIVEAVDDESSVGAVTWGSLGFDPAYDWEHSEDLTGKDSETQLSGATPWWHDIELSFCGNQGCDRCDSFGICSDCKYAGFDLSIGISNDFGLDALYSVNKAYGAAAEGFMETWNYFAPKTSYEAGCVKAINTPVCYGEPKTCGDHRSKSRCQAAYADGEYEDKNKPRTVKCFWEPAPNDGCDNCGNCVPTKWW